MDDVSNENLDLSNTPVVDAPLEEIARFADTYNAYKHLGSFEAVADIANEERHNTLTDLRACLFFEQRRLHHFGDGPDDEEETYLRELIAKIRGKVAAGERA